MKFKLSLIAIALANLGVAHGASFDLSLANTQGVDKHRWQCKRCVIPHASGELGVSLVATDADDPKAANRLGEDSEFGAALQANAVYPSQGQGRVRLHADDLGLETGSGELSFATDTFNLYGGYRSNLHLDSAHAQTPYDVIDNNLVNTGILSTIELSKKRESWLLGAEYQGDNWRSFVDYQYQTKTGQQAGSVALIKSPVNIVKPIDHRTQQLKAGAELVGEQWLAGLSYQGSLFDNKQAGIHNGERGSLIALEPSNEAHQVLVNGQYRWQQSVLSCRVIKGWQYQNEGYIDTLSVPLGITHLNGEVETWDADLRLTTRVSRDLSINVKADYRDRDNNTPVQSFSVVTYNPNSGVLRENQPLDTCRQGYQLDANYRLDKGLRLRGGYQYVERERSHTAREQTDEEHLFVKLSYKALADWNFSIQSDMSQRDGSVYDAANVTSNEDNPLLRKYHLADRDRNQIELKVSHTPMANLAVDVNYRLAKDEYDASELGLTESIDKGYDLSVNYHFNPQAELYLFAGQQWIESTQAGSQGFSRADWYGEVEDSFSHIGVGAVYAGLMQDKLQLGLDYQYSESESSTLVTGHNPYGDYTSWSHNVSVYANYQLSEQTQLRADYRYQRHYDTNYADVAVDAIPRLTTLGYLGSDYNAHQFMLTLSYTL